MEQLRDTVLKKIKQDAVTPRPRWQFALLHVSLAGTLMLSVGIGSLAVGVIIREMTATEWDLIRELGGGRLRSFFLVMPYLWFVCLVLTIVLAHVLFKRTEKGYRYRPIIIVGASAVLSILIGNGMYAVGTDAAIEQALRRNISPYERWAHRREVLYVAPDKGILAGVVIELHPDEHFSIQSFDGNAWVIDAQDARMRGDIMIEVNMPVGMIGTVTDERAFHAEEIRALRRQFPMIRNSMFEHARPPLPPMKEIIIE